MPYLIYLRKSRTDPETFGGSEVDTLARHKETLTAVARRMKLHIGAIYQEVVSGETIDARPQMQRLLREVESGQWDGVLVMEVERLARGDTIDQGIVARAFQLSGTKIITPSKTYDPNNEFDVEYFEFSLFMSRREYKTIRRRMQAGILSSRREGKYTGSIPPYGYDKYKLKGEKGYSLRPNQDAAIVQEIYQRYLAGESIGAIARSLQARGVPGRAGSTWTPVTVSKILHNPHYAGYTVDAREKSVKTIVDGIQVTRSRKNDNAILYPGRHEPLVSQEDWQAVRDKLAHNPVATVRAGMIPRNAFSGLIVCGVCGKKIQYRTQNDGVGRLCCMWRCGNMSHDYLELEQCILQELESMLKTYQSDSTAEPPDTAAQEHEINRLTRELADIQARTARAYDLVETGVYTPEVYTQRRADLDAQRSTTESRLAEITAERDRVLYAYRNRANMVPRIQSALQIYRESKTAAEKNAILKKLIDKIEYKKQLTDQGEKKISIKINIILDVDNF